jgi:hypothetical protein
MTSEMGARFPLPNEHALLDMGRLRPSSMISVEYGGGTLNLFSFEKD